MGCDHRDQSLRHVPRHPRGAAEDEGEGLGPDHQHGLGACAGRLAVQGRLCGGEHGIAGITKTVALETARNGITVNAICPGYVWTPLVEKQIPDTARARGMTEEQVKNDVILAAQPTKEFVTVEEVAALALFLTSDGAKQITGALLSLDGGWTAA
jgi:NAD(P)-dependent dehydrogenase (short-subunit alcohol dehydrogenase family)